MWIAENMANKKIGNDVCVNASVSSSNNSEITAIGRDGLSRMAIVAPSGISFSPKIDDDAVVIKTENGDVCIGTIMKKGDEKVGPLPGELFLSNKTGSAYIKLMEDGKVEIHGNLIINGEEF